MKDLITILICNAIRKAEHETRVKGGQLSDEEVLQIAIRGQADYHKTELMRFINTYGGVLAPQPRNSKAATGGTVIPPKDMIEAAKKSLGDKYDEFIGLHGSDFTPLQLAQFCDKQRAA